MPYCVLRSQLAEAWQAAMDRYLEAVKRLATANVDGNYPELRSLVVATRGAVEEAQCVLAEHEQEHKCGLADQPG